jgi:hypothetical protein
MACFTGSKTENISYNCVRTGIIYILPHHSSSDKIDLEESQRTISKMIKGLLYAH